MKWDADFAIQERGVDGEASGGDEDRTKCAKCNAATTEKSK